MPRLARPRLVLLLLTAAVLAGGSTSAADTVTLEGEFVWQRSDGDHAGGLRAVFTATGEQTWNVAFHFDWEDGPHTYSGTASGDLTTGKLEGEVVNDNPDRKQRFRFTGTFEDGTYSGTHGHVQEDGSLRDTGTLTLSRPGS
jgi:hypothetical protein